MLVTVTCPYCRLSRNIPREKIPPSARWAVCPRCQERFEFSLPEEPGRAFAERTPEQPAAGEARENGHGQGAPWERRSELGLWQALIQTLKAALFSPERLFGSIPSGNGIREPLAFGLLMGSAGSMLGLFWQFLVFSGSLLSFAPAFLGQFTAGLIFFALVVLAPLFVLAALFVYSGILHLLLLIVRGGRHGFEATFRVVSYSQAAQIWCLIPFLGGWIGAIWQIIIQIIGLREVHKTSYSRVIIAFLLPILLIFLLVMAILIPLIFLLLHQPSGRFWT